MDTAYLREFTRWALSVKKLSPQTVSIYLSDLKLAHKLRDLDCSHFEDFFTKAMIKGASNLLLYTDIIKKAKFVLTYPLLKLLGHEIAKSEWSVDSKRVIWTACCLAFFGSFRLGEILCIKDNVFSTENLTWENVQFFDTHAVVNIRFPKTIRGSKGDFVDIFPFSGCCPLDGLRSLAKLKPSFVAKNLPVFTFDNGKYLTNDQFTSTIKALLKNHIGANANFITGHSFRAGIPAALSNIPNLATDDDIKRWGRWSSSSYQVYTRLKLNARQAIFAKISSAFTSQVSHQSSTRRR
jgi:hypothetical protein